MTRWSWSAGGRASGCYWVVVSSNPRALAEDIAPRVDRVERARPCHQRREGRAPRVSTRRRRSGCSSRARRCGGRAPGAGTRSAPRPPRTSPRTSSRASWYVPLPDPSSRHRTRASLPSTTRAGRAPRVIVRALAATRPRHRRPSPRARPHRSKHPEPRRPPRPRRAPDETERSPRDTVPSPRTFPSAQLVFIFALTKHVDFDPAESATPAAESIPGYVPGLDAVTAADARANAKRRASPPPTRTCATPLSGVTIGKVVAASIAGDWPPRTRAR